MQCCSSTMVLDCREVGAALFYDACGIITIKCLKLFFTWTVPLTLKIFQEITTKIEINPINTKLYPKPCNDDHVL